MTVSWPRPRGPALTSATSQRPPLLSELSRRLCLLRFVLKELIQTEKDYVKDLGIVVEVGNNVVEFCFRPIRDGESQTWLSAGLRSGAELCPSHRRAT